MKFFRHRDEEAALVQADSGLVLGVPEDHGMCPR